jgi:hypothetical protein
MLALSIAILTPLPIPPQLEFNSRFFNQTNMPATNNNAVIVAGVLINSITAKQATAPINEKIQ